MAKYAKVKHLASRTADLEAHRLKTFNVSNGPQFADKVVDIVGLYLNLPDNALVTTLLNQAHEVYVRPAQVLSALALRAGAIGQLDSGNANIPLHVLHRHYERSLPGLVCVTPLARNSRSADARSATGGFSASFFVHLFSSRSIKSVTRPLQCHRPDLPVNERLWLSHSSYEAKQNSRCHGRADDPCNVRSHRMHQQEVLRVGLEPKLVRHPRRHRYCRYAC